MSNAAKVRKEEREGWRRKQSGVGKSGDETIEERKKGAACVCVGVCVRVQKK